MPAEALYFFLSMELRYGVLQLRGQLLHLGGMVVTVAQRAFGVKCLLRVL